MIYTVVWSYETQADDPKEAAEIAASVIATGSDPSASRRGYAFMSVRDERDRDCGDFEVEVPSTEAISYAEHGARL